MKGEPDTGDLVQWDHTLEGTQKGIVKAPRKHRHNTIEVWQVAPDGTLKTRHPKWYRVHILAHPTSV